MIVISEFIKLTILALAQFYTLEVKAISSEIAQRPLDGLNREILACSLPLNAACQTGLGKDMHNYCKCAVGLICKRQKCVRKINDGSTVLEGGIRIDEVAGDEIEPMEEREFDPIHDVQRPYAGPVGGALITKCSLGLGQECNARRGKSMHSYCSCAELLKCANHQCVRIDPDDTRPVFEGGVRIDETSDTEPGPIVQRPIGGGPIRQRPISPIKPKRTRRRKTKNCRRLSEGEKCRRSGANKTCPCQQGTWCRSGFCVKKLDT